jgi:hypothetical protein
MKLKYRTALVVLIWLALPVMTRGAFAETVEVAKKCDLLTARAFPPRELGNPAAGLTHGSAREASEYFRKCIENGGNTGASDKQQSPQKKK